MVIGHQVTIPRTVVILQKTIMGVVTQALPHLAFPAPLKGQRSPVLMDFVTMKVITVYDFLVLYL